MEWADIYVPHGKEAKYCYFNEKREEVELYESDGIIQINSNDNIANLLIQTTKIKTYLSILRIYLEESIAFNIIGASGSGTSLLLKNAITNLDGYELVTINCSSQLTASYVLYMLKQVWNMFIFIVCIDRFLNGLCFCRIH